MTLQQLTYFLAAVEHGSFSAAAQALLMAQPSLSEQIRRLEAELGVPLFARAGRGLELTEAGRLLRPHAERTWRPRRRPPSPFARCATSPAARSRSARSAARTTICSAAWSRTFARATRTSASARSARTPPRSPTRCARGGWRRGSWCCRSTTAGSRCARRCARSCCTSAPIPSACSAPMTIERLADAPLILYDARWGIDDPTRRQLRERAQQAGVQVEPQIEVEYVDRRARPVRPRARRHGRRRSRWCARAGYSRKLAGVPFDPPLYDTFAFITRRNAHLSPATREFIRLAEKRVQGLQRRITGALVVERLLDVEVRGSALARGGLARPRVAAASRAIGRRMAAGMRSAPGHR